MARGIDTAAHKACLTVGGDTVATLYAEKKRDDVEAIELNLSCPNVDEAPETSAEIVAGCRARTSKLLYAKLSPATTLVWAEGRAARPMPSSSKITTETGCS